jgi:hypothetical protein
MNGTGTAAATATHYAGLAVVELQAPQLLVLQALQVTW